MNRLDGKVAIISGAARGQGEAAARLFAAEGARVVIGDVLEAEGKAVASSIGDAARFVHLDISDQRSWAAAVEFAEREFGALHILVNNAAILRFSSIEQMSLEEYMDVVRVNQVGAFLGMKTAAPAITRAGGGSIVNIASIEGVVGMPGLVAYAATKGAVRAMTKVAAAELGRSKIRVNAVLPGGIDTPMSNPGGADLGDGIFKRIPLRRVGQPEEIARLVLFLASDEASYCTGSEFTADGGAVSSNVLKP